MSFDTGSRGERMIVRWIGRIGQLFCSIQSRSNTGPSPMEKGAPNYPVLSKPITGTDDMLRHQSENKQSPHLEIAFLK